MRAVKRSTSKMPAFIDPDILNQVEWVEGDILDIMALEAALQGIDTVIHAAAIVSFSKKGRNNMYHVNIEGTANVVNAALQTGVRRLVYISSVAALGRKRTAAPLTKPRNGKTAKTIRIMPSANSGQSWKPGADLRKD